MNGFRHVAPRKRRLCTINETWWFLIEISLFTRLRVSWIFSLNFPQVGQASLALYALTCTSILPSARMHWLTISHSGKSSGVIIPCFGLHSRLLCPSMVCCSGITCPLFEVDYFYFIERRTSSLLCSSLFFSYSPSAFTLMDRDPQPGSPSFRILLANPQQWLHA